MGSYETLDYAEQGEVATVTLTRRTTNMRMVRELTAVCDHLEDESTCTAVVFQGSGGVFSEGMDFREFRPDQPVDIHGFNKWEKLCVRIERLPKLTVAAIDGTAAGAGVQLALVCDLRIATPRSTLQLDEVRKGFLPGMATFRLAKSIGLGRAKELLLTGRKLTAENAVQIGILDSVAADLDATLRDRLAALQPINTVAVQLARRLLNESFSTSFEDGIGNFLAAQHRACTQSAFIRTLQKAHEQE